MLDSDAFFDLPDPPETDVSESSVSEWFVKNNLTYSIIPEPVDGFPVHEIDQGHVGKYAVAFGRYRLDIPPMESPYHIYDFIVSNPVRIFSALFPIFHNFFMNPPDELQTSIEKMSDQ